MQAAFDEHSYPGVGKLQPDILVQPGGACDDGIVEPERHQFRDGGEHRATQCHVDQARIWLHDAHQIHAVQAGQHSGMIAAHRTQPDQAGAQV